MERGLSAEFALVVGEDGREIEGSDGIEKKVDEIPLGEPVVWRGREEIALVGGPIAIGLGHASLGADGERLGGRDSVLFEGYGLKAILGQTPSQ
jgi:hypothetical protein